MSACGLSEAQELARRRAARHHRLDVAGAPQICRHGLRQPRTPLGLERQKGFSNRRRLERPAPVFGHRRVGRRRESLELSHQALAVVRTIRKRGDRLGRHGQHRDHWTDVEQRQPGLVHNGPARRRRRATDERNPRSQSDTRCVGARSWLDLRVSQRFAAAIKRCIRIARHMQDGSWCWPRKAARVLAGHLLSAPARTRWSRQIRSGWPVRGRGARRGRFGGCSCGHRHESGRPSAVARSRDGPSCAAWTPMARVPELPGTNTRLDHRSQSRLSRARPLRAQPVSRTRTGRSSS